VNPKDGLDRLFKAVCQLFGAEPTGFEAHIGVGFFSNASEAEQCRQRYQRNWQPFDMTVTELHVMHHQTEDAPFSVTAAAFVGPSHQKPAFSIGDNTHTICKSQPQPQVVLSGRGFADTHSALCIIPPASLTGMIQEIRKDHDTAFGRWMPHINLFFPFLSATDVALVEADIIAACQNTQPFQLSFPEVGSFRHGATCVHWAKPVTEPANALKKLQTQLSSLLREFKPFLPHLTLANPAPPSLLDKIKGMWKPFSYEVTHIAYIRRTGEGPFQVVTTYALGNQSQ
jgi:2'-5' RNA ligase